MKKSLFVSYDCFFYLFLWNEYVYQTSETADNKTTQ